MLKAIGSPLANYPKTDKNNVAPRIGLAWDITGDGNNVFRAGYGMYYGQGILNTYFYPTVLSKPVIYSTQTYTNSAIGVGPAGQLRLRRVAAAAGAAGADPVSGRPELAGLSVR